jgi:hypothetical protein
MPRIAAHGPELARYFDPAHHALMSVRADGTTYIRTIASGDWHLWRRKKVDLPLEEWRVKKLAMVVALPAWCQVVKALPTMKQLELWTYDSICETPTGDRVEPDGTGPDGTPSWLMALGMI